MNIFVILAVFLVFVGIDKFAIPAVMAADIPLSADYRTNLNYPELRAFIERINASAGPKVIMVGDSVTEGGGVSNGDETIAHYLQVDLQNADKPYHVYNLGLKGAAPGDAYNVIHAIHLNKGDVVLYGMNPSDYGTTPVNFPTVTGMLNPQKRFAIMQSQHPGTNPIEIALRLFVTNHWALFRDRNLIKDDLLGRNRTVHQTDPPPWYTSDWTARTKGIYKRGENTFHQNDGSLERLEWLIRDAKRAGALMFVYNVPLNQQMMAKYQMIDRPHYDENIKRLKTAIVNAGAQFGDYQKIVPSPNFVDSIHPTAKGNQIVAAALVHDVFS